MLCPNKNSQTWKDLVAKWGEEKALQLWQLEGDFKTTGENIEIKDALYDQISDDPDYFRDKYKTYLKNVSNLDYLTPTQMVEAFYARLANLNGKLDGDVVVTDTGNYTLFPIANIDYVAATNIPSQMKLSLERLQKKFNVPFKIINDPTLKWKGRYVNQGDGKVVYINTAYATEDTPLHEYYHPFVRMLFAQNPAMFNSILNDARVAGDTRADEEEVVTNYLAKEAVKRQPSNLFEMFLDFLRRILSNRNIKSYSTLKDVLGGLAKGIDVSGERTLTDAYDKIDDLMESAAKKMGIGNKEHPHILDKLVDASRKYTTSDATNFYQDELGNDAAIRLTSFIGDKELGEFSNYGKNFKWTQAEFTSRSVWSKYSEQPIDDNTPSSSLTGTINIDGQDLTFEQLHSFYKVQFDKARLKGKMTHSFLQYAFEEDPVKKTAARLQAIEYAKQYGEPFTKIEEHRDLKPIWDNLEQIAYDANLAVNVGEARKYGAKFKDRLAPEVTIVSELITDSNGNKIGTTADGITEHANGDLSILDWKTGFITKDMNTPYFLKYGAQFGLNDSKLTRGYLELAFRALIIKEQHPEARFREIKIVKVDRNGEVQNMRLELSPYLATIGEYYKKTNPDLYKKLVERKLLDAEAYMGVTKSLLDVESQIGNLPHEDRLTYLKNRLATLHQGKTKEQIQRDASIKEQSRRYTEAILELEKTAGTNLQESTTDIPYILGRFKNLSDISNPKVQTFHKALLKSKDQVAKEKKQLFDEHDKLLRELQQETSRRSNRYVDGLTGVVATVGIAMVNPWIPIGALLANKIVKRFNIKTRDYWAFMWAKGRDGFYLNTSDAYTINGQTKTMTPAQKKYRDFVKSSMAKQYFEFANELVAEDKYGRPISRAKALGIPSVLPDNFVPRIPKQFDEIREEETFLQNGLGIGSAVKYQTRKYLTSFIEQTFDNAHSPIPFSYFHHEESTVVQDELYSFDVEAAFKSFMTNMIYKKHMDSMYDLSLGVVATLNDELDEAGNARYPNLSKFVDETIFPQVLGTSKAVELRSKKWQFTAKPWTAKILGIKEGTPITISQDKVMRLAKSSITMMTLGFKVFGPIRNAAMISLTTISQATKRPINKMLSSLAGVPPDAFDNINTTAATELVRDYYKNLMTGTLEKSKLWNVATRMNWLPDEIPGVVPPDHLLSKPLSLSLNSHAYMLYQIGEVGGSLWQLAGLLKGTKVKSADGKESTLWDAYDREGNWTLGVRGVVERGDGTLKKLEELDELEIKTLKRINERLNGSYRSEEKTAIEATVLGELIFQFKKYFYQFLKVNFGGEYKDLTYGKYVLDNSAPDGVPKYKWMAEALEGRINVLAKSMWILLTNGTNGWKKLKTYLTETSVSSTGTASNARIRALSEGLNTAVWLSVLLWVFSEFFDDDDEKTHMARDVYKVIIDNSRGLHPKDIFETAEKPIVGAQRLSDLGDAMFNFLFSGVIGGKETQDGYPVGSKTLLRATPFVGSRMQYIDRFSEYDADTDPLFSFSR